MTWHPTTNRIQTMHLTPEERAALEAWPHGWERFNGGKWKTVEEPDWAKFFIYRGKPAPVVTSVWFNVYSDWVGEAYCHKLEAEQAADSECIGRLRIDTCNGVSTAHLEGLE